MPTVWARRDDPDFIQERPDIQLKLVETDGVSVVTTSQSDSLHVEVNTRTVYPTLPKKYLPICFRTSLTRSIS